MDFETTIIVGPTDTDSYNIIHHPQYFIWIEKVILEWLISTDRACLKFQVSIANQTTRHPVIEADFFVKVSGKIAWLA